MNVVENGNNNNNKSDNNKSKQNNTRSFPSLQRYEFPVLAEDPVSISKARTDPLACNVNNDAVLIWNDVIIHHDDRDAFPGATTIRPDVSIEDVFQELQTTVAAYNGVPSGISNDEVDGVEFENLKEYLHNSQRLQPCNHEDAVVFRRRLYEQGLDLPFISKLNTDKENNGRENNLVNLSCSVFDNSKIGNGDHSNSSDFEKISMKQHSEEKLNILEDGEFVMKNKIDDIDSSKYFSASDEMLIGNDNSLVVLTVENGEDSGVEKSHHDSGHYDDMSFRSSAGSNVLLSTDYDKENRIGQNKDNYHGDNTMSVDSLHSESRDDNLVDDEHCSFHNDSVFLDDGKENDTTISVNGINAYPSHRPRRRPYQVKLYSKTRDRSSKGRRKHNNSAPKTEKIWRNDTSIEVRCANESCKNVTNLLEARKSYKNCHHCLNTYYCSRGCRRENWGRHKEQGFCHGSRVSSACKNVIQYCNTNPEIKAVLTRLALRGYLSHGRGCVMLGFPDLESTNEFMEFGFPMLELNPIYVSAKELSHSKMYGNVLDKLLETCRTYKPEMKFVLNVGVGLRFNKEDFLSFSWHYQGNQYCYRNQNHEEMDTFGSLGSDMGYGSLSSNLNTSGKSTLSSPSTPKNRFSHSFVFDNNSQRSPSSRHKAPILQKFIKLRLSPSHAQHMHEKRYTFEKHFWDEFRTAGPTLILTSIPERTGNDIDQSESRKRELTFINIQRKLRERNVNLRQQYPIVHAHLIAYVTKGVHFPSQVLFPVDSNTGRIFTCFMMPEAEAELEWMQSHHLLNDLELSKDSLNKSLSKSLSTSMPSLYSQSQQEDISNLDASFGCSYKNNDKEITVKHRSISFNSLECLDNVDNSVKPPVPSVYSPRKSEVKNAQHHGSRLSGREMGTGDFETAECTCTNEPPPRSNHVRKQSFKEETNLMSPIEIHIDNSYPSIVIDRTSDLSSEKSKNELLCENRIEEFKWATNQEITPRFYPVRKARNVKLYSNSHHSSSSSIEPFTKSRQKPSPIISTTTTTRTTSFSLTPSSSAAVLSSSPPPALSPALYTSTPKTTKPPVFEALIAAQKSSPTRDQSLSSQNPQEKYSVETASGIASIKPKNDFLCCECCHSAKQHKNIRVHFSELDDGLIQNSDHHVEYGFDSCYRNKVVVDEVDQMKRRRKDRNPKCKGSSTSSSPITSSRQSHNDSHYHIFQENILFSPPLATSTLNRRTAVLHGKPDNSSSRHSKRKAKHKKLNGFDENENIVNDRNASYENLHTPCNICQISLIRDRSYLRCQECIQRDPKTNRMEKIEIHEEGEDTHCVKQNENACVVINSHSEQFSPRFRREFNTNSPYFPTDYRIRNSPTSNNRDFNNNDHDCYRPRHPEKFHNSESRFRDKVSPDKPRDSSINSMISKPLTNDFTLNNVDDDRVTMTNNFNQPILRKPDDTLEAFTPKKTHRYHSSKNAIIPSSPSNPHRSNHNQHLRMHLYEDVTRDLANQTQDSRKTPCPSTSSSKRKLKGDMHCSDRTNYCENVIPRHSERPPFSTRVRSNKEVSSSSLVKVEPTRDGINKTHTNAMPSQSPIKNVSYSSDW